MFVENHSKPNLRATVTYFPLGPNLLKYTSYVQKTTSQLYISTYKAHIMVSRHKTQREQVLQNFHIIETFCAYHFPFRHIVVCTTIEMRVAVCNSS